MRACHAVVMPCRQDHTGDMDGIPTVFMEAMATGRPVISCPISGIPELVRDGETGLLVPSDDPQALAGAIERLARDESLRVQLGRQGRALVERQHRSAYDRAPPPPSDARGRAAGRGRGGGPELSLPRGVPHGLASSTWQRSR